MGNSKGTRERAIEKVTDLTGKDKSAEVVEPGSIPDDCLCSRKVESQVSKGGGETWDSIRE
jgi:hypothetical protein